LRIGSICYLETPSKYAGASLQAIPSPRFLACSTAIFRGSALAFASQENRETTIPSVKKGARNIGRALNQYALLIVIRLFANECSYRSHIRSFKLY